MSVLAIKPKGSIKVQGARFDRVVNDIMHIREVIRRARLRLGAHIPYFGLEPVGG